MSYLFKSAATLACVATLAACGSTKNSNGGDGTMINTAAITANKALTPAEKAEQLARAGEQLAQSSGFPLADAVLDQALAIDPTNKIAQLYKAVLADKMALRGIAVRIRPLLANDAKAAAQFKESVAQIPNGALKDFILDGKEDIATENDVQAFLDEMHAGREQLREFLKANKDSQITLRLNDVFANSQMEQAIKDCSVTTPEPGVYQGSEKCDFTTAMEVKLNRADMEMLQQSVAGIQVYSTMYNSYNLTGSIQTAKKLENKKASNSAVVAELAKHPEFATLRNKDLSKVVDMGIDAIAGIRWAAQLQKELCPRGENAKNQRPGFLFKDGICIDKNNSGDQNLDTVLAQIEMALKGGAVPLEDLNTSIVPAKALTNPVQDLKSLQPRFNKCDELMSVSDSTLNGVFPNNDLNSILGAGTTCGRN